MSHFRSSRSNDPFCRVCCDAGKPASVFLSHFIRDRPGPSGKVVCPTILAYECRYCKETGHTIKFCVKLQAKREQEVERRASEPRPDYKPRSPPVERPTTAPVKSVATSNSFQALSVEPTSPKAAPEKKEEEFPTLSGKPEVRSASTVAPRWRSVTTSNVKLSDVSVVKPTPAPIKSTSTMMSDPLRAHDARQKHILGTQPIAVRERASKGTIAWSSIQAWNAYVVISKPSMSREDEAMVERVRDNDDFNVRRVNRDKWVKSILDSHLAHSGSRGYANRMAEHDYPRLKQRDRREISLGELTDIIMAHREEIKVWHQARKTEKLAAKAPKAPVNLNINGKSWGDLMDDDYFETPESSHPVAFQRTCSNESEPDGAW